VIRLRLVGLVGKAVEVNLKTAFFTVEHETCKDPEVSQRSLPLYASPSRRAFADGGRFVIERGIHWQLMRVGGNDYGMVVRQVESSGEEIEEVRH
jgi:hypothetical protein